MKHLLCLHSIGHVVDSQYYSSVMDMTMPVWMPSSAEQAQENTWREVWREIYLNLISVTHQWGHCKSFPAIGFLTAKTGTILPDHDCASLWGLQSCLEVPLLVPGEHLLVTTSNAYHSLWASYSTYAALPLSSSFSLQPRLLNKPFHAGVSTSSPSHSLLNPLKAGCCR